MKLTTLGCSIALASASLSDDVSSIQLASVLEDTLSQITTDQAAVLQKIKDGDLTKRDIEIVVARYNEDITWTSMYGDLVTVYNKGQALNARGIKEVHRPNIGRESGTYLEHVVDNYDNLADWTVFTQGEEPTFGYNGHRSGGGHMMKGVTFHDYVLSPKASGATFFITSAMSLNAENYFGHRVRSAYTKNVAVGEDTEMCPAGGEDDWDSWFNLPHWFVSAIEALQREQEAEIGDKFNPAAFFTQYIGGMPTDRTYFSQGARFAVSRENIHQKPQSYYKRLLETTMNQDPWSGFYLEWFWAYVFNADLSACQEKSQIPSTSSILEAKHSKGRMLSVSGISGVSGTGAPTAAPTSPTTTGSPTPNYSCDFSKVLQCYTDFAMDIAGAANAAEVCEIGYTNFGPCMGSCVGSKVSFGEGGVDALAPICGRGDGPKDLYNMIAASEEPKCEEMLEVLCGEDQVVMTASIVATVDAEDAALYLDETNALNIQLRADTCAAVIVALDDAISKSGASVSSSSSAITFSCTATVEAESRRRRLGGPQASLRVTTAAKSTETFSPEEASEFKDQVVNAENDIFGALMTSAKSVPGVAVDLTQDVDLEASNGSPEEGEPAPGGNGSGDDGLSTGAIVAIAIGAIVGVGVAAVAVIYVAGKKSGTLKPEDSMKIPKASKNNSMKLSKTGATDADYDKDL